MQSRRAAWAGAARTIPQGPLLCGHVLTGWVGLREKRARARRYVVFTHALEITAARLQRLVRAILRSADAVVTISEFTRRALERMGVPPDNIHLIQNAIEPERFEAGRTPTGAVTVDGLPWEKARGRRIVLTVAGFRTMLTTGPH